MQIGSANQSTSNQVQNTNTVGNKQDPRIRAIQKEIENVRKQLNELAENDNMSVEQKKQRREQLNEQMKQLNERLSQTQTQIQRENMEKTKSAMEDKSHNSNTKGTGFSEDIISLDLSLKQMENLGSIKTSMEGYAKILKSQIKMDSERGVNSTDKQKELSEVQRGISNAETQINEKLKDVHEKENSDKKDVDDVKDDSVNSDKETTTQEKKDDNNLKSIDIKL